MADKNTLRYELQTQLEQVPNDKTFIFFKPRLWFYYRQEEKGDSTDFDKFVQRKLVEPPSLYDPSKTEETVKKMDELLFNKGYLEAQVWYEDTIINQHARVHYFVKPNRLFRIESFDFEVRDSTVRTIVESKQHETLLRPGDPVSSARVGMEKQRIITAMQNDGYADFSFGNFGALEATDTSDATVRSRLPIIPGQQGQFKRKYVGNVVINNLFRRDQMGFSQVLTLDSVRFVNFDHKNKIKPSTLLNYIKLRPNELYRKSDLNETRVQLQLPAVRFADIKTRSRSPNTDTVDFEIDLYPAKQFETNVEFELNRTTVSNLSFIGLGTNLSLVNNNFFGGSERFSNGIDISFEVNPKAKPSEFINAANVNFHNTLEIPRFTGFLGLYTALNKSKLIGDHRIATLESSANTILDIGYEYVDLFKFFNYHSVSAEYGFRSVTNGINFRKRVQITHPSLTYFNPTIKVRFDSLYNQQTFARKSFAPQLLTSAFFNKFVYTLERFQGARGFSSALIGSFEVTGAEMYLANLIINGLEKPLSLGELSFANFVKFEVDGRLYKQFNPEQVLALRANLGIAAPFGTTDVIPFVKQFYLGGPLSMRAWRIRELGPGSYEDATITRESGNPFFQTGDLKLLLNAEYRFDVFWRIEGALFLDAGNIWTLKKDEREGGSISSAFLDQMAVGSGMGIRFDADYFKVVLDIGVKVRNPYADEEGKHLAIRSGLPTSEVINWNFAINYPF